MKFFYQTVINLYFTSFYPYIVDHNVLHCNTVNQRLVESAVAVTDVYILKREVTKGVFVARADIKEAPAIHIHITHDDVIALRQRHIRPFFGLEELCPRAHH